MKNLECAKTSLYRMIYFLMKRAETFEVEDFAALKICLVSFGLLLGSTFSKFFKRLSPLIKVVFVLSYVFLIWRIFFQPQED